MFVYVSFTFCYFCFDLIEKYPEFDREIAANLKKMAAILKMMAILDLKMSYLVSLTLKTLRNWYHTR